MTSPWILVALTILSVSATVAFAFANVYVAVGLFGAATIVISFMQAVLHESAQKENFQLRTMSNPILREKRNGGQAKNA